MTLILNGTDGVSDVDGTAATPAIRGTDTNTGMFFPAADTIAFAEGGVESMRINSDGNLVLGTSTVGGIADAGFRARINFASSSGLRLDTTSTNATQAVQFVYNNNTQVGTIATTTTATTYGTSSDYRLKENVAPMTGALSVVQALKPVTYNWKVDGSDGQGFIAHELQEVVPDCVTGEKDAVNEDGSIKPQGIDTSFLVATLTAAIQELKAELDTVKAELAALKA
jgi:hypothetical protein